MIDYFYMLCEKYGGFIGAWAWRKRWSNRKEGTGYLKLAKK